MAHKKIGVLKRKCNLQVILQIQGGFLFEHCFDCSVMALDTPRCQVAEHGVGAFEENHSSQRLDCIHIRSLKCMLQATESLAIQRSVQQGLHRFATSILIPNGAEECCAVAKAGTPGQPCRQVWNEAILQDHSPCLIPLPKIHKSRASAFGTCGEICSGNVKTENSKGRIFFAVFLRPAVLRHHCFLLSIASLILSIHAGNGRRLREIPTRTILGIMNKLGTRRRPWARLPGPRTLVTCWPILITLDRQTDKFL